MTNPEDFVKVINNSEWDSKGNPLWNFDAVIQAINWCVNQRMTNNKLSAEETLTELKKVIEYIERNANKINNLTCDVYRDQILGHIEDAKYYASLLSQPTEGQQESISDLVEAQDSYITFLSNHYNQVHSIARVHGYKTQEADIQKGEKLRQTIADLKASLQTLSPINQNNNQ